MNNIQNIIDHAEQHCSEHGEKLTEKRKKVLLGLLKSQRALSAYELIEYCKTEFNETLPAMSVYRILEFLQQQELVHKLNLANKFVACSHISCDHAHAFSQFLICNQCQKVKEININKSILQEIESNIAEADYRLISPHFEMDCLCNECEASLDKKG
ncbi:transcriptional repressor [Psychromonas sp.]|nr:transcriptional repressor [Psychromonas sp.]